MRALGGRQVLTVGVGPSFATRWLIPRLAAFGRRAPGIAVRITTGGIAAPFDEDWTCGIRLGDGTWPGLVATPLFPADLLPVCVPAIAARLRGAPAALAGETLLRVAHAPEGWPHWLAAAGAEGVRARGGPVFDRYGRALRAAADGLGVAMGIRPHVDDDLAAGRLMAPFGISVSKGKGWFLVHRPAREAEPGFAAFRDWIVQAAAAGRARTP